MKTKRIFVVLAFFGIVTLSGCGGASVFHPTCEEHYKLADFGLKGKVKKVVLTTYQVDDPNTKISVAIQKFDGSGLVRSSEETNFLTGVTTLYRFQYNSNGTIKSIKAKNSSTSILLDYKYKRRENVRECVAINGQQKMVCEKVWYDQNGYPARRESSEDEEKYWVYSYNSSGQLLSRESHFKDGAGTLLLNYVYSGYVGSNWTREVSQDDMGNQYGSIVQSFNSNGDLEEMTSKTSGIEASVKMQYTYDSKGNWIESFKTTSVANGHPSVQRTTREINY